jgi:hypothetical protein
MKTDSRTAVMLLALDTLMFADRISDEWDADKQLRHLREQIALARKHLESDPGEAMKQVQAEVESLRGCKAAEMEWEKLMMRLIGEDGLGSVETAVMALKQERDQLKAALQRVDDPATALIEDADEIVELLRAIGAGNTDALADTVDRVADELTEALNETPVQSLAAHDAEVIEREAKPIATEFFRWWYNQPGSNTDQGFDEWWQLRHQAKEAGQ